MATLNPNNDINIMSNAGDVFQKVADDLLHRAINAVESQGMFRIAISAGNTYKSFFDFITESQYYKEHIPWEKIQFFFADERYLPSNNPENNYHMAYEHLFSKVPVLPENIYRVQTELGSANFAAEDYQSTLKIEFGLNSGQWPKFDVVYLGLGIDAHTASLMPFSDVVSAFTTAKESNENDLMVASLWVPALNMFRITLTPPAINNAASVVFLVTGHKKAAAVEHVLDNAMDPQRYPAQLIHCQNSKTHWYLDHEAAANLHLATNGD